MYVPASGCSISSFLLSNASDKASICKRASMTGFIGSLSSAVLARPIKEVKNSAQSLICYFVYIDSGLTIDEFNVYTHNGETIDGRKRTLCM